MPVIQTALVALVVLSVLGCSALHRTKRRLVERMASKFGTIVVYDEGAYRCFGFNKIGEVQSCVHRREPLNFRYEYVRLMFTASVMVKKLRRVLVLGLGGAALPRLVSTYHKASVLDIVEIDPGVVRMAGKHFGFRPGARTKVHVEDAAVFVRRRARALRGTASVTGKVARKADLRGTASATGSGTVKARAARYDLILFDCFGPDYIPDHLLTGRFVEEMGSLLEPYGLLAVNVWGDHRAYPGILSRYGRLFPELWILKGTSGNHILLASHRPVFGSISELAERASRFDREVKPVFSVLAELSKLVRYFR